MVEKIGVAIGLLLAISGIIGIPIVDEKFDLMPDLSSGLQPYFLPIQEGTLDTGTVKKMKKVATDEIEGGKQKRNFGQGRVHYLLAKIRKNKQAANKNHWQQKFRSMFGG